MVEEMARGLIEMARREAEARTMKFRFVGGPLHNRMIVMTPDCQKFLASYVEVVEIGHGLARPNMRQVAYHRLYFRTEGRRTLYEQFVCESLIGSDGLPASAADCESLPTFERGSYGGLRVSGRNKRGQSSQTAEI